MAAVSLSPQQTVPLLNGSTTYVPQTDVGSLRGVQTVSPTTNLLIRLQESRLHFRLVDKAGLLLASYLQIFVPEISTWEQLCGCYFPYPAVQNSYRVEQNNPQCRHFHAGTNIKACILVTV